MPAGVPPPEPAPAGRRPRRPGVIVTALTAAVLVLAVAVELAARWTYAPVPQLWLVVLATVAFVPAVVLLRRLERGGGLRRPARVVFGVGLLLQVLALSGPPAQSDDDWRYLWDGRVQVHGIDPYRYSARAHQLQDVRTPTFFPPARPCQYHLFAEDGLPERDQNGCTRMNRPRANTVYPPVAEAFFAAVYLLTFGGHGNEFVMQVAGALGATLVGWLLWRRARARGDPVWWVAVWAWCPTVVLEAVQNAHIDWAGALLVTVAITVVPTRRVLLRGLLLGAAAGVKLYPAVVGAPLLRRRPLVLVAGAVGLFALGYVPHVLAVGTKVIGFLPSYLQQENYSTGQRFLLVSLVFRGGTATVAAVATVALAVLWAVWRGDPEHPERTAVVLFGTVLLVATPNQAWYTLLLVALAVLARRPEWLVLGPVMEVYYLARGHVGDVEAVGRWGYVLALLVVVGATLGRTVRRSAPTGPPPATPRDPAARPAG